jgi:addiction module HigA family antidote
MKSTSMHNPKIRLVHPGEMLREEIEALGLTIKDAARLLRMARPHLYQVMKGQSGITPELALKIGKLIGNGPGIWLRVQLNYDLKMARWRMADVLDQIPEPDQIAARVRQLHGLEAA